MNPTAFEPTPGPFPVAAAVADGVADPAGAAAVVAAGAAESSSSLLPQAVAKMARPAARATSRLTVFRRCMRCLLLEWCVVVRSMGARAQGGDGWDGRRPVDGRWVRWSGRSRRR